MAVIWVCHVGQHHGAQCCLRLEGSAHFVLSSTVAYPSRPSSVVTSSGKHSQKQPLPLCEVFHVSSLADPGCPSALTLNRVHLWFFCLFPVLFMDPGGQWLCSLYVCLASAWQMFIYTKGKVAFIVLLWIMVKLHAEIRGNNLHIFEKNISSSFVNFFIFLFWCEHDFDEIILSSLFPSLLSLPSFLSLPLPQPPFPLPLPFTDLERSWQLFTWNKLNDWSPTKQTEDN